MICPDQSFRQISTSFMKFSLVMVGSYDISPQDNSTPVITDLPHSSEDFTVPFSYPDLIQNLQNPSTSQQLSLTQPLPSTNDYLQNQSFPLGNSVKPSNSNRTIRNTLGNHTSDIYQQRSSPLNQHHQPQEYQPLLQSNTDFQNKFVQNSQFSEAHALHQDTNNNNNNNNNSDLNNNNIVPNLMSTFNYHSHGYQGNNINNNLIQPSFAGSTQLMDPTNYLLSSLKQPQISPSDLVMLPNLVANNLLVQSQALNPLYSLLLNTQQPRQLHPYLAYPPTLYPIPQQMHTADQLASNIFPGFGNPSSHFSHQQQQFTAQQQFPLHNSRLAQPRRTQYYNNERNLNEENMEDWKRDMMNKESRILKERYGENNMNTSRHLSQPSDEFNLSNQNFPPQNGRDDNQQLPMHIPHHSTEEINNENIHLESTPLIIATTTNNSNNDNNDNDNNCVDIDTLNQKSEDEQNIFEEQQNNSNSSSSSSNSSSSEDERATDEKNKISYPNLPATSDEEGANSSHDNNTVFYDQNTQFQANNSTIVPGFIARRSQNQQQSPLVVEKHTSLESIPNPQSLSNSEHATDLLVVSHSQTSTFPQDTHVDSCPDQSNILVLSKSHTSTEIYTTPSHFISPTNAQDSIFHEESDLSSNLTFPPSLNSSNTNSRNNTKSIAKLFYPPTNLPNVCYPPNDSSILDSSNKMDLSTHIINTNTSIFMPPIELAATSNEQSNSTMLSSRHYKKVSFNLPSQPTNKFDMFTIDKPSKQTKRQISYPPSYSKHTSPPKKTIQHPTQLQADNDIQILYPPTEFKPLIKYPPKFLTPPNSTLANPQLTSHMNHSIPPFKSTYHVPPPMFNFIPSMEIQHSPPTRDESLYKDIIYPPKYDLNECISSCASNDVSNFFEDSFTEYSPKHDSSHYELLRPPPLNDVISIDKQTQVSHSNILSETSADSSEDNQLTSTPIGDQKESKKTLRESFDEEKICLDFESETEETNKKSDHPDSDSYQSASNTDNFHSATELERPIDKYID